MRLLLRFLAVIIIMFFITFVQVAAREFFPFPFNGINIIFLSLVALMLFTNSTTVLWLALLPSLLIELFSPLPFGFTSLALVSGLLVTSSLLTTFFTNHSSPIAFLVGLIGMSVYRLVFLLLLFIASFFHYTLVFSLSVLVEWLLEILLTNIILVLVHFLSQRLFRRLQPQYVHLSSFT